MQLRAPELEVVEGRMRHLMGDDTRPDVPAMEHDPPHVWKPPPASVLETKPLIGMHGGFGFRILTRLRWILLVRPRPHRPLVWEDAHTKGGRPLADEADTEVDRAY